MVIYYDPTKLSLNEILCQHNILMLFILVGQVIFFPSVCSSSPVLFQELHGLMLLWMPPHVTF